MVCSAPISTFHAQGKVVTQHRHSLRIELLLFARTLQIPKGNFPEGILLFFLINKKRGCVEGRLVHSSRNGVQTQ